MFGCSYFQSHKYTYYNRLPELRHHCYNEERSYTLLTINRWLHTTAPWILRANLKHYSEPVSQLQPLKCPRVIQPHLILFPWLILNFSFIPMVDPEQHGNAEPRNGVKMVDHLINQVKCDQKMSFFFITVVSRPSIFLLSPTISFSLRVSAEQFGRGS